MGRVRTELQLNGRKAWTLFDTGARNSYVVPEVAKDHPALALRQPFEVALGGARHSLTRRVQIEASIEDKPIVLDAFVMDSLGNDEDGKAIEVLFGALDMQRWGIRPVPDEERLDLSHYTKEFIEY